MVKKGTDVLSVEKKIQKKPTFVIRDKEVCAYLGGL